MTDYTVPADQFWDFQELQERKKLITEYAEKELKC